MVGAEAIGQKEGASAIRVTFNVFVGKRISVGEG